MKASKLTIIASLIKELESIGFNVITETGSIKLMEGGSYVDVTSVFESEVQALENIDFGSQDVNTAFFDSAVNIEAYFVNVLDAQGFYLV